MDEARDPTAHQLLPTSIVARLLDVTPGGVHAMVHRGALRPAIVLPTGQRLFAREDIARLRAARDQRHG